MKLLSILAASILVAIAAAQGIDIGSPAEGQNVTPGQQLTIEVIKNDDIESSIEAGLVIGIVPCPVASNPTGCSPDDLGSILYNGPYNPQLNGHQFSESFTVTIPDSIPTGVAQISIARFFLIGAGNSPTLGGITGSVNVVEYYHPKAGSQYR